MGAALLGLDAAESPVLATVLTGRGLPADYVVDGSLEPFDDVRLPPVAVRRAACTLADSDPALGRLLDVALVDTPREHTQHDDDAVLRTLRAGLAPWVSAAEVPGGEAGLVAAVTAIGGLATWLGAWQTSYGKDSLSRREAPLGLDLTEWDADAYDAVIDLLRPLETVIAALPPSHDGMRWTHLDGSVLFEMTRTMRASYESWIARVDIGSAVSLMADYLGGRRVVVTRDAEGRAVHQAERNLYLPQPNYVAFAGGPVIDVCKIEVVEHGPSWQKIWWRTVRSPNGSADHDDGSVEFADDGDGRTRVTVRGRQRFPLPPALRAVDLDAAPELRDALTDDAYRRFFTTTLDNVAACYEGRPWAIGRPADPELVSRRWSRLLTAARAMATDTGTSWNLAGDAMTAGDPTTTRPDPTDVDAGGFRHVRGNRG